MPVTESLNKVFGIGDDSALFRTLRDQYLLSDEEEGRRKRMRRRKDLYRDRGYKHYDETLRRLFKNRVVLEERRKFIEFAVYQNLTRRVTREISSVYSEPAERKSSTGQRYRDLQAEVRMDRRMRMVNRYGNLQNNVLVWPDINAVNDPVVRVITQDKLWAIAHPDDHTLPVGYIIDKFPAAKNAKETMPHYLGIDGESFFKLDKHWRMIEGSREPHNVGFLPAILYSREENDESILDAWSGEDLVSAHLAIALLNILLVKHQRSGTKQAYATGDLSTTANNQPMDEEHLLQIGEGVTLNTLDLGANPENYIKAGRSVIKQVAANYGIPESVFDLSYQATSGFEIELKRAGLREVRRDQIADFRPFEQQLAKIQSAVLKAAGHPLSFEVTGWSINFGEIDVPQDPIQKLTYWEKKEQMDLANRIEMYLHENPELKPEAAAAAVERNRAMRVERMQDFQSSNSGAFGPTESENPPTDREGNRLQNGADPALEIVMEVLGGS